MPFPIIPLPWSNGPHDGWCGAVVLSVTDFRHRRQEDLDACAAIAMKLAATWPVMQGAVALRFWAMPDQLRIGALTAWQETSDLQRFVWWPVHQTERRTLPLDLLPTGERRYVGAPDRRWIRTCAHCPSGCSSRQPPSPRS